MLLHGWPDSVLRFERVLPLLTDLNVVAPCLPGFPFAPPLTRPGMSMTKMAEVVDGAVNGLGYDRYVVSGGDVESVFPRDDLLTWVTAYWVTGTIGTSFSSYAEPNEPAAWVPTPAAVTIFPHDLVPAPRSIAERFFDVRVWTEEPAGGHFAAWERPERFVDGLRAGVALAT